MKLLPNDYSKLKGTLWKWKEHPGYVVKIIAVFTDRIGMVDYKYVKSSGQVKVGTQFCSFLEPFFKKAIFIGRDGTIQDNQT